MKGTWRGRCVFCTVETINTHLFQLEISLFCPSLFSISYSPPFFTSLSFALFACVCVCVCVYLRERWWWRRVASRCRTTGRWLQTRTGWGSRCRVSLHSEERPEVRLTRPRHHNLKGCSLKVGSSQAATSIQHSNHLFPLLSIKLTLSIHELQSGYISHPFKHPPPFSSCSLPATCTSDSSLLFLLGTQPQL